MTRYPGALRRTHPAHGVLRRLFAWVVLTGALVVALAACGRGSAPATQSLPSTTSATTSASSTPSDASGDATGGASDDAPDPVASLEALLDQAEQDVDEVSD